MDKMAEEVLHNKRAREADDIVQEQLDGLQQMNRLLRKHIVETWSKADDEDVAGIECFSVYRDNAQLIFEMLNRGPYSVIPRVFDLECQMRRVEAKVGMEPPLKTAVAHMGHEGEGGMLG